MFNVGVDFGSTNTIVSVYQEDSKKLEVVELGTGVPCVPSMVACKDGDLEKVWSGAAAKGKIGKKGFTLYKAFKMLLAEQDSGILQKRGYTKNHTPIVIAEKFLNDLVVEVLKYYGESKIDCLVIGAPEIWFNRVDTMSGRNVLRNIFEKMECVKEVQVVSEPAAASAFFAYNYEQIRKKAFEGHILLIDYGGGTLDISLSKVSVEKAADGKSFMEINVADRQGAGENENGQIGNAGIVYMERLLEAAIQKAGLLEKGEKPETDAAFYKAVNELEDNMRASTVDISNTFRDIGIDALDELEEEEFASVTYKGEEVEISYALMVEVYDAVIRNVFQEKLNKSIRYMENAGINYKDPLCEELKIALVGGFGNFYLVRKQMEDTFRFASQDKRQEDIIVKKSDCENAISLGTALLAAKVVGIRHTAPYSVGIFQRDAEGKPRIDYAIRYRQELKEGELYYHQKANGKISQFFIIGNSISNLVINHETDDSMAIVLPLKKEFQRELTGVIKNPHNAAVIAFSMDCSDVLTIYIGEHDRKTKKTGKMEPYELANFEKLFDTIELTRVMDLQ